MLAESIKENILKYVRSIKQTILKYISDNKVNFLLICKYSRLTLIGLIPFGMLYYLGECFSLNSYLESYISQIRYIRGWYICIAVAIPIINFIFIMIIREVVFLVFLCYPDFERSAGNSYSMILLDTIVYVINIYLDFIQSLINKTIDYMNFLQQVIKEIGGVKVFGKYLVTRYLWKPLLNILRFAVQSDCFVIFHKVCNNVVIYLEKRPVLLTVLFIVGIRLSCYIMYVDYIYIKTMYTIIRLTLTGLAVIAPFIPSQKTEVNNFPILNKYMASKLERIVKCIMCFIVFVILLVICLCFYSNATLILLSYFGLILFGILIIMFSSVYLFGASTIIIGSINTTCSITLPSVINMTSCNVLPNISIPNINLKMHINFSNLNMPTFVSTNMLSSVSFIKGTNNGFILLNKFVHQGQMMFIRYNSNLSKAEIRKIHVKMLEDKALYSSNIHDDWRNILKYGNKKSGVYMIVNDLTKDFYIGSRVNLNKRLRCYFQPSYLEKHGPKLAIVGRIVKYGIENFTFHILEYTSENHTSFQEKKYLIRYDPSYNMTKDTGHHYSNKLTRSQREMRLGEGNSFYGKTHTVATKALLSKAALNRVRDPNPGFMINVLDTNTGISTDYKSMRRRAARLNTGHPLISKYRKSNKLYLNRYVITVKDELKSP